MHLTKPDNPTSNKAKSQPAGCTPPRPENRPGEAGELGTPLEAETKKIC